jgi:hypothetical protein
MMRLFNANFAVSGTHHVEDGYFRSSYDFERNILARFPKATLIHVWLI